MTEFWRGSGGGVRYTSWSHVRVNSNERDTTGEKYKII